jgi:hypothetical protein
LDNANVGKILSFKEIPNWYLLFNATEVA